MKDKNDSKLSVTGIETEKQPLPEMARIGIGIGVMLVALLMIIGIYSLSVNRLYVRNPTFTLRNIEINTDNELLKRTITICLKSKGAQEGISTLPDLDLKGVREELLQNPRISEVELRRIFPDTLRVTVKERIPVAILRFNPRFGQPELKIDEFGYVVPSDLPGVSSVLPTIIGLDDPDQFSLGQKTNDLQVLAFLTFLKETTLRPEGTMYEVNIARLDKQKDSMTLFLDARGPFKSSARVIMPTNDDIATNLDRIKIIVSLRLENNQTISYLNATYGNIPVKP